MYCPIVEEKLVAPYGYFIPEPYSWYMVSNKDENSPYLFPILRNKDGTEAAYKEYQSALRRFNYQLYQL